MNETGNWKFCVLGFVNSISTCSGTSMFNLEYAGTFLFPMKDGLGTHGDGRTVNVFKDQTVTVYVCFLITKIK